MKLAVYSNITKLIEGKPRDLRRWLRVSDKKARYDQRFIAGLWDGYINFFDMATRTFPTGLLRFVVKRCESRGIPLELDYQFELPKSKPIAEDFILVDTPEGRVPLRDYQVDVVNTILNCGAGGVEFATGSGKSAITAAITAALYLQHDIRSIVFVPRIGLLKQMRDDLESAYQGELSVGIVGAGMRQVNEQITVATPQTLRFALPEKTEYRNGHLHVLRKHEPILLNLIRSCNCLLLDEAHHGSSDTWYELSLTSPALYRIALSGTLKNENKANNLRLCGIVNKRVAKVRSEKLWKRDILAKPHVYAITDRSIYGSKRTRKGRYQELFDKLIIDNKKYNKTVARLARYLIKIGKPPLIFTHRVAHIRELKRLFDHNNIPCRALYGQHTIGTRSSVKDAFTQGGQFAIIASTIWDEGENVPNIASIILAGGGKGARALRQRMGRGMRRKKDDNRLSIFDFTHSHCSMLNEHYKARLKVYREDGIEVVNVDSINSLSQYDI